ncbi:hypothetical protein BH09PSE5_BH09PSE5_46720 [soil metagenome]
MLCAAKEPILRLIQECTTVRDHFDPAMTERLFTLFLTDIGDITPVPERLEQFRLQAPHARLRTVGLPFGEAGRT